ncbi:MAG TPA: hypothetical protein VK972_09395 [Wenzhouxiangella sp.]|nr:hypothetical protein [Wenzhouxiangella sp.]
MALQFDAESHTYTLDGATLPGVTTVIEEAAQSMRFVPEGVLIPAQWRGTVVHKATELFDFDMLDWDTLDADLHGYIHSWEKFVSRTKLEIDYMEQSLYHPKYLYAGTMDRAGSLTWKRRRRNAVIDLKTGVPVKGTAMQTAAYQRAIKDLHGEDYKTRLGVYLKPDGGEPEVVEYTEAGDFNMFLAMLKIYRWKENK